MSDQPHYLNAYTGLPFQRGGRVREGLDCVGLSALWLREQLGVELDVPATPEDCTAPDSILTVLNGCSYDAAHLQYGDVVFFASKKLPGVKVTHVAIYCGERRYLHVTKGSLSCVHRGTALMERVGMLPVFMVSGRNSERLNRALREPGLGEASIVTLALVLLSVALSVASSFLTPKPKLGQFRNQQGLYSFDQLITQTNPTLPIPNVLGAVTVAGNSPYQSRADKTQAITDSTAQKVNKVVILGAGPCEDVAYQSNLIKINGRPYTDTYWHASGFALDPAQTKAEAVDGTISSLVNRPSVSVYKGTHAISVPVDVRAQYDRNFPIYGFAGTSYLVLRLIDSTKFSQFNLTATVKGRLCREFGSSGFTATSVVAESLAGADGSKVRFKLANIDVVSVTALTVNGTAYSEISESNQSGNVYSVNKLKGYVEFITAPAAAATIALDYSYYVRTWTQNPARHLIYLLTEKDHGYGLDADKINWTLANTLQTACNASTTWQTASGPVTSSKWTSNYSLDTRKPLPDHLRAVLDACYSILFLSGGKCSLKERTTGASVFSFDESTILVVKQGTERRSTFSSEMVDRSTRANRVHLFFNPAETLQAETEVIREDPTNQRARESRFGNFGVSEDTLHMPAVDTVGQAERLAEQIVRENIGSRWVVELRTNIQGIGIEPGDLVDVTHSSQPSWVDKLFRVEDVGLDELDRLTLKLSEYVESAFI